MAERRRSDRFRYSLPVDLHERRGTRRLVTGDIGRHGIYLLTEDPPAERLLVQLTIHLADSTVPVLAAVARRILPTDPLAARLGIGAGVQFFALAPEAKDRWDDFIANLRGETRLPPEHRAHTRFAASFLVKLKDVDRLRELFTHDISEGGVFLATPVVQDVGTELGLVMIHPDTDEEFPLHGAVARVQAAPSKGMGIRLLHFDDAQREAFREFIETGVAALRSQATREDGRTAAGAPPPLPVEELALEEGHASGTPTGAATPTETATPISPSTPPATEAQAARYPTVPAAAHANGGAGRIVPAAGPGATDPDVQSLGREIERRPLAVDLRVRLANHLLRIGDAGAAADAAQAALDLDQRHPLALVVLARALVAAGRFGDADKALRRARKFGHVGDESLAAEIAHGLRR